MPVRIAVPFTRPLGESWRLLDDPRRDGGGIDGGIVGIRLGAIDERRSTVDTRSDDAAPAPPSVVLPCSSASRASAVSSRIDPTRANELLRRQAVITSTTGPVTCGGKIGSSRRMAAVVDAELFRPNGGAPTVSSKRTQPSPHTSL